MGATRHSGKAQASREAVKRDGQGLWGKWRCQRLRSNGECSRTAQRSEWDVRRLHRLWVSRNDMIKRVGSRSSHHPVRGCRGRCWGGCGRGRGLTARHSTRRFVVRTVVVLGADRRVDRLRRRDTYSMVQHRSPHCLMGAAITLLFAQRVHPCLKEHAWPSKHTQIGGVFLDHPHPGGQQHRCTRRLWECVKEPTDQQHPQPLGAQAETHT